MYCEPKENEEWCWPLRSLKTSLLGLYVGAHFFLCGNHYCSILSRKYSMYYVLNCRLRSVAFITKKRWSQCVSCARQVWRITERDKMEASCIHTYPFLSLSFSLISTELPRDLQWTRVNVLPQHVASAVRATVMACISKRGRGRERSGKRQRQGGTDCIIMYEPPSEPHRQKHVDGVVCVVCEPSYLCLPLSQPVTYVLPNSEA